MSVESHNATPPGPAIAPGAEGIDVRRSAERIASRGMDPRVTALVPAFNAPFFQAGLAGYSDAAMRIIARRHGCPFCVTEALLDRTLLAGGRGFAKADLGELHDNVPGGAEDHPLACQIMGSDPREMAAAALKAAEQGQRGDKHYRLLAYAVDGVLPTTHAAQQNSGHQHLRLPGGEQLGAWDPSEGLEEITCGDSCEDVIDRITEIDTESSGPLSTPPRGTGMLPVSTRSISSIFASSEIHRITREEEKVEDGDTGSMPVPRDEVEGRTREYSFETIDVNLACPVKKIKAKARGGHWLAEPEGAIKILEAVREAVPPGIPCTVKMRRSFDDTPEMAANFDTILHAAERLGYAWATVHARTVEQKYVGPSRWDLLRGIVQRHRAIPVFGSGDIWHAADIVRMIEYTGVSAVAVARGCIGNPWIFRQARELLAGREPGAPTIAEQRAVLDEHFRLLLSVNQGMRHGEEHTSKLMRKFGIRFSTHHPRAEEVRKKMIAVRSMSDWQELLTEYYPALGFQSHCKSH